MKNMSKRRPLQYGFSKAQQLQLLFHYSLSLKYLHAHHFSPFFCGCIEEFLFSLQLLNFQFYFSYFQEYHFFMNSSSRYPSFWFSLAISYSFIGATRDTFPSMHFRSSLSCYRIFLPDSVLLISLFMLVYLFGSYCLKVQSTGIIPSFWKWNIFSTMLSVIPLLVFTKSRGFVVPDLHLFPTELYLIPKWLPLLLSFISLTLLHFSHNIVSLVYWFNQYFSTTPNIVNKMGADFIL